MCYLQLDNLFRKSQQMDTKCQIDVSHQNKKEIERLKQKELSRVKRVTDNAGRKRRIYSEIHKDPKQSNRRFRANDRERRRMNSLNGALQSLKGCVPLYHGKKRMTKLQILQFACNYISDLSDILCSPSSTSNHTNLEAHSYQLNNSLSSMLYSLVNEQQQNTGEHYDINELPHRNEHQNSYQLLCDYYYGNTSSYYSPPDSTGNTSMYSSHLPYSIEPAYNQI